MARRRFFALRTISVLLKIFSFLTIISAVITAVTVALSALNNSAYVPALSQFTSSGPAGTVGVVVGVILGGLISAVVLYGLANILDALVSIEAGTRRTNELLEVLARVPPTVTR